MIETPAQAVILFFIYSFLGWVCECIYCSAGQRKWINRGFLAGPYCPIYGFGGVFVLTLLEPVADSFWMVFLWGVVITSTLEYLTSYVMEKLFHTRWWDYSRYRFNLNGRICLLNSTLFGLMCLFVVYIIHPPILNAVQQIPIQLLWVMNAALLIYSSTDVFKTVHALLRRNKEFVELEKCMQELREAMKNVDQLGEEIPFYERVQAVMDSTDADEQLAAMINKMVSRIDLMPKRTFKIRSRLNKAFPHQVNPEFSNEFRAWVDQTRNRTKKAFDEKKDAIVEKIENTLGR